MSDVGVIWKDSKINMEKLETKSPTWYGIDFKFRLKIEFPLEGYVSIDGKKATYKVNIINVKKYSPDTVIVKKTDDNLKMMLHIEKVEEITPISITNFKKEKDD